MGLDMTLSAKRYLWGHGFESLRQSVAKVLDIPEGFEAKEVLVEAAYWRKANQIHNWFVKNVQDGKDECQTVWVSREQLQNLIDACKEVLADHSSAESLLPTQSGFFFGNTEYNEYYFGDLEYTVTMLEKALTLDTEWEFEYHSSW